MELLDYKIFVHLSQTLHFGHTAKSLGMSPSALTRRIQGMEEEVEHKLLIRAHREITLTQAGESFRSFSHRQLDQWDEFMSELRSDAAEPTGTLHIACTVTAAHSILPQLLATFRSQYPQVTLRLLTQDATQSLNQLETGEVDVAVIPTEEEGPHGLVASILGETELAFIGPLDLQDWQEHLSSSPARIEELPLVVPTLGLERARLDAWSKERNLSPQIVAEVRGNEGIIAMVSLGAGIGLVPRLVLENSPLRQRVQELVQLEAPRGYKISLCTRPKNLERRIIQLFWQVAQDGLASTSGEEPMCKS